MDIASDKMKTPSKWELSSNHSSSSNMKTDSSQSGWRTPSTSQPPMANTPSSGKKTKAKLIFSFTLLKSHVVTKLKEKMYKCDICLSSYRHAFSLKRHFLRNHVSIKYISQSDINNCKINVNSKGVVDEALNCDSDERSSDSSSAHEKHANEIVCSNEDEVKMVGLYRCHKCKGLKFDSREEMRSHFQKHLDSTKLQYPCEKCNVVFSHKQALYRHLTSHSGSTTYPCTTCGKVFENKALFHKHTMTHTDGRTCKYCKKVLSTKANRIRHERIHQGLKPYPCKHCNIQFTQSGDLKKHLKDEHGSLYVTCHVCSNLFSCKSALKKHIADKHKHKHGEHSQTNHTNSASKKSNAIPAVQKVPSNLHPPQAGKMSKFHQCSICKKWYHSYLSVLHHKRRCHPSPNTVHNRVHKKIRYFTRRQSLFQKRNNVEIPEEDFYKSLSSMITDNLINYVDGKTNQLSLKEYNFSEPLEQRPSLPSDQWSLYNFPSSFNVEQALQDNAQEIQSAFALPMDGEPIRNELDYSLMKINGVDCDSSSDCDNSDCDVSSSLVRRYKDYKNINVEERKKLIGRSVNSVVLCNLCRESLPNRKAFLEHSSNNHPNVLCSCIEIEGEKDSPPFIPEDLQRHFLSPAGVYLSYNVPEQEEKAALKCTKCQLMLTSSSDLHQHIILCGGSDRTSSHAQKSRKIKRVLKKRFSAAYLEGRLGKRSPNGSPGRELPSFRIAVGRPRTNPALLCPQCKQNFRTKGLLSHHMNYCYKKVGTKSRYLKMGMRKDEVPFKPQLSSPAFQKDVAKKNTTSNEIDYPGPPPLAESPGGRLSPSLEVLVNSIKEKLTAEEELSPSIPTFSWMEDGPFTESHCTKPLAVISGNRKEEKLLGSPVKIAEESDRMCVVDADALVIDDTGIDHDIHVTVISEAEKQTADVQKNTTIPCENKALSSEPKYIRVVNDVDPIQHAAMKKKPGPQKYKPKVNPYVKKRRKKKAKASFVMVSASQSFPSEEESVNTVVSNQSGSGENGFSAKAEDAVIDNDLESIVPRTILPPADLKVKKKKKKTKALPVMAAASQKSEEESVFTVAPNQSEENELSPAAEVTAISNDLKLIARRKSFPPAELGKKKRKKKVKPSSVKKPASQNVISEQESVLTVASSQPKENGFSLPPTTEVETISNDLESVGLQKRFLPPELSKKKRKKKAKSSSVMASTSQSFPSEEELALTVTPNQSEGNALCPTADDAAVSNDLDPVVPRNIFLAAEVSTKPATNAIIANATIVEASEPAKVAPVVSPSGIKRAVRYSRNDSSKRLRCPFCMLDFAYVSMFRRHISECPQRKTKSESATQESAPSLFLPKKDEVEESMLNLLRHQSRQSKMMKEAKTVDSNDVKNFQTYTCDRCHKIFFSLFKLLQHRVVHKLQGNGDQNESPYKASADTKDTMPGSLDASNSFALTAPTLQISPPARRISFSRPSSAPIAMLPSPTAGDLNSPVASSQAALSLEIPTSSENFNHSGPLSAPIRMGVNAPSPRISKSLSVGSLPENTEPLSETSPQDLMNELPELDSTISEDQKQIEIGEENKPAAEIKSEEHKSIFSKSPNRPLKRKTIDALSKGPSTKRRKKFKRKRLLVRKYDYLTKQQLLKRAMKILEPNPEVDESSQLFNSSSETVIASPEVDAQIATTSSSATLPEEVTFAAASTPKRAAPKPPSPENLANRTCLHCGKVFSSTNYTNRHMLKHVGISTNRRVISPKSSAFKIKKTLKKKLLKKKRLLKRNALQRVCKTKFFSLPQ